MDDKQIKDFGYPAPTNYTAFQFGIERGKSSPYPEWFIRGVPLGIAMGPWIAAIGQVFGAKTVKVWSHDGAKFRLVQFSWSLL